MASRREDTTAEEPAVAASVRVDKWLWAARFFKTRSMATAACDGGHVKINGRTAKPATKVQVPDQVDVVTPGGRKLLEVAKLGDRRGSASVAVTLYVDHTPPPPEDEPRVLRERIGRRPTKRDRRRRTRLKGW